MFIGIDPDVDKSGFAAWDGNQFVELDNMVFWEIIDALANYSTLYQRRLRVMIEAGWLNKKSNYHYAKNKSTGERIAKNVGSNHQVGKLLAEYCDTNNINFELIRPTNKKLDSISFKQLTGYSKQTNPEKRDAGMLVWGRKC